MFHSTFVMNYITWNSVLCPYPIMTFEHKGLLNTDSTDQDFSTLKSMAKYDRRGFNTLLDCSEWKSRHVCGRNAYCARTVRGVTDGATLRAVYIGGLEASADVLDASLLWSLASITSCLGGNDSPNPENLLGFVCTTEGAEFSTNMALLSLNGILTVISHRSPPVYCCSSSKQRLSITRQTAHAPLIATCFCA
jgi:hypothetical protein